MSPNFIFVARGINDSFGRVTTRLSFVPANRRVHRFFVVRVGRVLRRPVDFNGRLRVAMLGAVIGRLRGVSQANETCPLTAQYAVQYFYYGALGGQLRFQPYFFQAAKRSEHAIRHSFFPSKRAAASRGGAFQFNRFSAPINVFVVKIAAISGGVSKQGRQGGLFRRFICQASNAGRRRCFAENDCQVGRYFCVYRSFGVFAFYATVRGTICSSFFRSKGDAIMG